MTLKPEVIVDLAYGGSDSTASLQNRYANAEVIRLDVRENAGGLPFRDQSVDLLFANFLLPFVGDIETSLLEFRRVLRTDGLLMLSALGPDTLKEFSREEIVATLMDMHDLGDLLLKQFCDPVIDVDYCTFSYRKQASLLEELQSTGMLRASADPGETLEVSFEIIFAHAFAPLASNEVSASEDGMVRIPLSHLRRNLTR